MDVDSQLAIAVAIHRSRYLPHDLTMDGSCARTRNAPNPYDAFRRNGWKAYCRNHPPLMIAPARLNTPDAFTSTIALPSTFTISPLIVMLPPASITMLPVPTFNSSP